jgi:hypothetical protein
MLSGKRELAEMTVSSGESWLARMSREELKSLFDRQAVYYEGILIPEKAWIR